MKKIILVVVIATLFVCAFAPAAFADGSFPFMQLARFPYEDYYQGIAVVGEPNISKYDKVAIYEDENGNSYLVRSLFMTYDATAKTISVESHTRYQITDLDNYPYEETFTMYMLYSLGEPQGSYFSETYAATYEPILIGNVDVVNGTVDVLPMDYQIINSDSTDDGNDPIAGILSGIGQSLQSVIGWVGQVVPLVKEYPGFIMMIAVPLFVGIVTWVTTIYKRRRG